MVASSLMDELLQAAGASFVLPKLGTLVEGVVIDVIGNKILVDIDGIATGIISGKESRDSDGTIKGLKAGDIISAYLIEGENEDGYYVLSLRKASQERTWRNFLKSYEDAKVFPVTVHEANKGGLLVLLDGIKGFIPVSQLAPLHYPRVDGANPGEILTRLSKLIGEKLHIKIINIDREGGKLILSEKAAMDDERLAILSKMNVGDTVDGHVSGIVKFGIFVAFNGLEGLVHISEIEWGHVKDPTNYAKIGQNVRVKIIGIDKDKISLSMKQLLADPWDAAATEYTVGKVVEGKVDRITQFGVFVKLNNDLSGLIHLSELSHETVKDPNKVVKIGQKVKVKIITVDLAERRIGLSLKALLEPPLEDEKKATAEKKTEEKESSSEKEVS